MLTLLTGQPGHGKTAYGLTRALNWKKEGREVYAFGIKDLDYDAIGFKRLEDPTKWMDLPDGSAIILDECYNQFPNRNPGAKVPEHVNLLATHRHRGFDFIFIAQQTVQIDPFMKGLFEEHIHVRKKFGKVTTLLRWSAFQSNVKAICTDAQKWMRPNDVFKYYTSTTVNTSKLHVPAWVKTIAIALAVMGGLLWYLKSSVTSKVEATVAENRADAPTAMRAGGAAANTAAQKPPATPLEYAKQHLPRFASMPWTAPAFDARQVTADPQLICASSLGGTDANGEFKEASCTCLTEQSTRYDIAQGECRRIAAQGPIYNPYKQRIGMEPAQVIQAQPQATSAAPAALGVGERAWGGQMAPYGPAEPQPRS